MNRENVTSTRSSTGVPSFNGQRNVMPKFKLNVPLSYEGFNLNLYITESRKEIWPFLWLIKKRLPEKLRSKGWNAARESFQRCQLFQSFTSTSGSDVVSRCV